MQSSGGSVKAARPQADVLGRCATGDHHHSLAAAQAIGRLDDVGVAKLLVALGRGLADLVRERPSVALVPRSARAPRTPTGVSARPEPQETAQPAPSPPVPATWAEAKAGSPGLLSYAQAKAADPGITIIDHLRDTARRYGAGTLRPPGLPRSSLSRIDRSAYKALYNWLARTGGDEDPKQKLPPDPCLPTRSELATVDVTPDEVKAAGRLAAQWRRQQARAARLKTSGERSEPRPAFGHDFQ